MNNHMHPCRFILILLAGILGLASSARLGLGRHRVEAFLLKSLRDATREKYQQAIQLLNREILQTQTDWASLTEAEQDLFLAEWLVDGYEQGSGRTEYGYVLSALGRMNPRVRYKIAWRVFEVWGSLQPPQQAPAAPPELLTAMMVAAFALNRAPLGILICVCFSGLLRVGEALQLRWSDIFFAAGNVTLCLGQTKGGMEQKVVISNGTVFEWLGRFGAQHGACATDTKVFDMSYSSVLRWVKKLALLLAGEEIKLTTHSFRRSGASELCRQGVAIADICLFGRWLSDRSAREYIRKGEVAILRSRTMVSESVRANWHRWCRLAPKVWLLNSFFHQTNLDHVSHSRVTETSFRRLENLLFEHFGLS